MADDEEIQAPSPPSEMTALQRRRAPNAAERQYFGASSVKFGASAPALKQTRPTSRNILTSKIESSGGQLSVAAAPERPQAERRYPKGQGLLLDHLGGSSAGISADAVHTYKPPKSVGLPYPYAQTNYGPTQVQVDGYGDRIFSRGFRNSQEVHRNHLDQKAAVIPHPGRWLRSRGLVGPPPPEQGLQRGTFTHGKSILFESSNQVKRGLPPPARPRPRSYGHAQRLGYSHSQDRDGQMSSAAATETRSYAARARPTKLLVESRATEPSPAEVLEGLRGGARHPWGPGASVGFERRGRPQRFPRDRDAPPPRSGVRSGEGDERPHVDLWAHDPWARPGDRAAEQLVANRVAAARQRLGASTVSSVLMPTSLSASSSAVAQRVPASSSAVAQGGRRAPAPRGLDRYSHADDAAAEEAAAAEAATAGAGEAAEEEAGEYEGGAHPQGAPLVVSPIATTKAAAPPAAPPGERARWTWRESARLGQTARRGSLAGSAYGLCEAVEALVRKATERPRPRRYPGGQAWGAESADLAAEGAGRERRAARSRLRTYPRKQRMGHESSPKSQNGGGSRGRSSERRSRGAPPRGKRESAPPLRTTASTED